ACEVGGPVVVKPRDANHGRGVFTNMTERSQIEGAYEAAMKEGTGVLVERFAPGNEHRLLVVGDRMVAASRGEAVDVIGNGRGTVAELVAEQINSDPRRGEDETFPLNPIEFSPTTVMQIEQQGYRIDSVPSEGAKVLVQRYDNLSIDVTDEVHPSIAAHAVLA